MPSPLGKDPRKAAALLGDLREVQFDRRFTPEDADQHLDFGLRRIDFAHDTAEIREGAGGDAHHVARLEVHLDFRGFLHGRLGHAPGGQTGADEVTYVRPHELKIVTEPQPGALAATLGQEAALAAEGFEVR